MTNQDEPNEVDLPSNLLKDLDTQQNEVILKLDELNERVDLLLGEWTNQRSEDAA